VTYEHLGDLGDTIEQVREMIEPPLTHPELYQRFGIDPPKGVLLHGPPGTGKTHLARPVANEADAHVFHIAGPENMGRNYGGSEGRLREIFEEARQQSPSIIFIDEIDSLAPQRGGARSDRAGGQHAAGRDGRAGAAAGVVMIGATNRPALLDPALLRPGRFDELVYVPVPDRGGRLGILRIHSAAMPLGSDVSLESLADRTQGYTGADLEDLTRRAGLQALQEDSNAEKVPMRVFEVALKIPARR